LAQKLWKHSARNATRKRNNKIPARFADVIDKALEKQAKDRFQNASELLAAMKKALP